MHGMCVFVRYFWFEEISCFVRYFVIDRSAEAEVDMDPRNTAWSNDDSKFGQRMLEKMGWSKGKVS